MSLRFIGINSSEYDQALRLRYQLFYQEHGIDLEAIRTADRQAHNSPTEPPHQHLALTDKDTGQVLAYGQLGQNGPDEFQVYQMVVDPKYQRQGLGRQILATLVDRAIAQGATHVVLHARVSKMQFYEKSGFEPTGDVFPSPQTRVPHIKMVRSIKTFPSQM